MRVTSKENVQEPIRTPHGEVIYELVGQPEEHGGVVQHSLAHVVIPPGKASLAHYHVLSEETYYILRGKALMVVEDVEYPLTTGHAFLIRPGETHRIFNSGEEDLEFLAISAPAWHAGDSYPQ